MGKNAIIFGADVRFSVDIDNKNKDILILGEGASQGLYDTILTAEAIYPINLRQLNKRFKLSLHYNESNFLFVNTTNIYQFKEKDYTLCLGNILKDFAINNIKNRINRNCK